MGLCNSFLPTSASGMELLDLIFIFRKVVTNTMPKIANTA